LPETCPFALATGCASCYSPLLLAPRPFEEANRMDLVTILSVIETLRGGSRKKGGLMLGVKNLLALVGLLVVGFAVAGWYLGWYNIGTQVDSQGHSHVDVQIDPAKVTNDIKNGRQEVVNTIEQHTTAGPQPTTSVSPPAAAPTSVMPPAPVMPPLPPSVPVAPPAQPPSFPVMHQDDPEIPLVSQPNVQTQQQPQQSSSWLFRAPVAE
jgi:hypothetical protein